MRFTNQRFFNVLLHVVFWSAFLFLPYVFFLPPSQVDPSILPEMEEDPELLAVLRDMIANFLIIGYFYLNVYVLIPRFYLRHRYVAFAIITVLCYGAVKVSPFYTPPYDRNGIWYAFYEPVTMVSDWNHHVFRFSFAFFVSLLWSIQMRLRETESQRINAELLYLKAQINPHFLFNTLNSIYALAVTKSDRTADALVKLSGMMRYVAGDVHGNKVPLEKEINYIAAYVDLQTLRWGNTVNVKFDAQGDFTGKSIEPLLLLPFVENAFKHGVNPELPEALIQIQLSVTGNALRLNVTNRKARVTHEEPSGIGLENTRQRLKLLYPGKHALEVREDECIFSVILSIELA